MRKYYLFLICLISLWANAAVKLTVAPLKPSVNDVIALTFEIPGQDNNQPPDFSPLEKDFDILSTAKSSSVSIVNQVVKAQTFWRVNIMPKRKGTFAIPSIAFGKDTTDKKIITISGMQAKPIAGDRKAFMETSINKKSAYVQEGLTYKIKLFYKIDLTSGRLTAPPKPSNARLIKLGQVNEYQTSINGSIYQVSEQNYAVFPEKSGEITIESPIFQGAMRRDNYSQMSQMLMDVTKPVRLRGKTLSVKVKPTPKSYPQNDTWLPATAFSLKESWQGIDTPKVGQPITRTITMSAVGLAASQLPDINFTAPEGTNVYSQKAETHNDFLRGDISSTKILRVTYIPTKGQQLSLPSTRLPWWDLKTNQLRYVTLGGKKISLPKPQQTKHVSPEAIKANKPITSSAKSLAPKTPLLPWLLVAILSLAWLVFLSKRLFIKKISKIKKSLAQRSDYPNIKEAIKSNDKKKIQEAIIIEARELYKKPDIISLGDIKKLCQSNELKHRLDDLEESLYGDKSTWRSERLAQAWADELALQKRKPKKSDFDLPAFNP